MNDLLIIYGIGYLVAVVMLFALTRIAKLKVHFVEIIALSLFSWVVPLIFIIVLLLEWNEKRIAKKRAQTSKTETWIKIVLKRVALIIIIIVIIILIACFW